MSTITKAQENAKAVAKSAVKNATKGSSKAPAKDAHLPSPLPATPDRQAVDDLRMILDGQFGELREDIRELLNDPFFLPKIDGTLDEIRDDILPVLERFRDAGYAYDSFSRANGGSGKADRRPVGPVGRRHR